MCVEIRDSRYSAATDVDIVWLSPHCTAAQLLLNPREGLLAKNSVWKNHVVMKVQVTPASKGTEETCWICSSEADRLNQYESNILSSKVLITQGFIKTWPPEGCSRFIASVSEHINSITASHQSCVYGGRPSSRQRQVSSWPARTHTIIFWALKEPEQHIAKSWQSAGLMLCNYEGLVLEVSLNEVLWNRRRVEGDRPEGWVNPAPLITVLNHPKQK